MPPARVPHLSEQRLGAAAVFAAAVLSFGVQLLDPVGVPLYDGVAVQEPYRYLDPAGNQPGSPTSYSATLELVGGASPQIAASTTEIPAQAQLIVLPGALVLAEGTTRVQVAVTPVEPPAAPPGGQIAGNVYRFSITNESGTPLAIRACDGCVSMVIRAPEETGTARLQRYANGAWTDVETVHAGIVGMYATNPTVLGDYAIVTGGSVGPGGSGGGGTVGDAEPAAITWLIIAGGVAVVLVLAVAAFLVLRGRSAPAPAASGRPVPSKRRKPRRPPPGGPQR